MSAIKIDGMTCGACVETIQNALSGLVDAKEFAIDLDLGIAHFNEPFDEDKILLAINNSGYPASLIDDSKHHETPKSKDKSAYDLAPLYIILSYILMGSLGLNAFNFTSGKFMTDFMGLFYIVFSLFKFIDYRNFPRAFSRYDPIAKTFIGYGWIYPFIEVYLGINLLSGQHIVPTLIITLLVLGATTVGVLNNLIKKNPLQCACMGTAIQLPLTKATFIENVIMIGMAIWMLVTIFLNG